MGRRRKRLRRREGEGGGEGKGGVKQKGEEEKEWISNWHLRATYVLLTQFIELNCNRH